MCEWHDIIHKRKELKISIGDVLMIQSDDKRRGHWKIRRLKELSWGKDEGIRGLKIKTAQCFIQSSYFVGDLLSSPKQKSHIFLKINSSDINDVTSLKSTFLMTFFTTKTFNI